MRSRSDGRVVPSEADVLAFASQAGFALTQYETDSGRLLWEWRSPSPPSPMFGSREVAVHWMSDRLCRADRVAVDRSA
ncbi:MAG TPA: hypothetical protein VH986_08470 [Acidimicrobiia bacterium]|jgi:hypothetical protein